MNKTNKKDKSSSLNILKGVEQPPQINNLIVDKIKIKKIEDLDVEELYERIRNDDRVALARGITLIESNLPKVQEKAQKLIDKCIKHSGYAYRIGVTGVPGAGKSTFIEAIGMYLIEKGYKIAVLAVDPSSEISKGSILGDKTRMEKLSAHPSAFIRPSPSGGILGGVARRTRETMILCDAANFDVVFVETVGVGQSEVMVKNMVDFFLLLMVAGTGDELQGIKRGIMEMADAIVINKADGENRQNALNMVPTFQQALHYFPPTESGWTPKVTYCSSITNENIPEVWNIIEEYKNYTTKNNYLYLNRKKQEIKQLHQTIQDFLIQSFNNDENIKKLLKQTEEKITKNEITPYQAAQILIEAYRKK